MANGFGATTPSPQIEVSPSVYPRSNTSDRHGLARRSTARESDEFPISTNFSRAEAAGHALAARLVAEELGEIDSLIENIPAFGINRQPGAEHDADTQSQRRPDQAERGASRAAASRISNMPIPAAMPARTVSPRSRHCSGEISSGRVRSQASKSGAAGSNAGSSPPDGPEGATAPSGRPFFTPPARSINSPSVEPIGTS